MKRGANSYRKKKVDKVNNSNSTLDIIDLDLAILETLSKSENPVSTREICIKLGKSWHSIQYHCLRLQLQGKIHGFRVGRMNLWQTRNLTMLSEKKED